jgi:tetratricopeptide (TPR) repeat protein
MNTQAEIHKLKSEYVEARSIHSRILQETSLDQDFYAYGLALLNLAEIDVLIGAPKEDVQRNCDAAKKIFKTAIEVKMCDTILADLYLRDGNMLEAKTLFERYIKEFSGICEMLAYCLERLGNFSHWGYVDEMSSQTTVFLVHSIKSKENLGIHKALQFLGDVFLQDDEYTAISLFTVALEGFTYMDVRCSRAECMLKLADISKGQGNLLKAVELWETARPLFEQSSQAKQVGYVDQRLAGVSKDVLEQHNKNLARLAKLNVSSTAVKDTDGLGANIEAMEDLELEDEKVLDVIAS